MSYENVKASEIKVGDVIKDGNDVRVTKVGKTGSMVHLELPRGETLSLAPDRKVQRKK